MTQPTPQPQPEAISPGAAQFFASMPVFKYLVQYIQAAASGDRATLFHLFVAVFTSARAAVRVLAEHYNANPRQRTFDTYARLKYCFARIPAILYTLQHAPERFLTPAQLRAITRARAVLAHIWNQPVTFDPLTPYLTSPDNCPPPPRSAACPSLGTPLRTPRSALHSSDAPRSASSSPSPANPLLLNSPGRVLASVLLQLAAIYGVSSSRVPAPRPAPAPVPSPATSTAPSAPAASSPGEPRPIDPNSASNPLAPPSELRAPYSPQPPP